MNLQDIQERLWIYMFAGSFLLLGGFLMMHSTIEIINRYNLGNTMFFVITGCLISVGVFFAVLGVLIIYEVEKSREKTVNT